MLSEYEYERRQQVDREVFERLKARYEIIVATPAQATVAQAGDAAGEEVP